MCKKKKKGGWEGGAESIPPNIELYRVTVVHKVISLSYIDTKYIILVSRNAMFIYFIFYMKKMFSKITLFIHSSLLLVVFRTIVFIMPSLNKFSFWL